MPKVIISDTSCLILLSQIGELDILRKVYGTVAITADILSEFDEEIPAWIEVLKVKDLQRQRILQTQIDLGEASAIALALESDNATLILDDLKARRLAEKLQLNVTGTVGVMIRAKHMGIIPSIKPFLTEIKQTKFRVSNELEAMALKIAGEI
ncbi:MAG: DUF3368 domain-containing protein [Cryomorphaceae bacterium]|nr:DUF3368 domain-containing protein [Flavobacteriales bacterium]